MNDENLIPIPQRTKSEQREITQKGGKCSGVARRKKRLDITLRQWHGILIITAIESMMGNMPKELLFSVGIEDLYKENKAVFCSYFPQFLDNYLFQKGVREKYGYFLGRKLYFYVSI